MKDLLSPAFTCFPVLSEKTGSAKLSAFSASGGLRPGKQKAEAAPAALEMLAARVAALGISRTDPEAFFVAKDEVAYELRRLARELRRAA